MLNFHFYQNFYLNTLLNNHPLNAFPGPVSKPINLLPSQYVKFETPPIFKMQVGSFNFNFSIINL